MIDFLNYIADTWYIYLGFIAIGVVAGVLIYRFVKLPTSEQIQKVREWLLWRVTLAEKELGGGTGQLKLRMVYDAFVARFGWLAKIIPFRVFSDLVDDALEEMRELLANNKAVAEYVEGPVIQNE